MATVISPTAFAARTDLSDWRYLLGCIETTYRAPSFAAAAGLVVAIAAAADALDHHPDIDVRYPGRVHVVLTTHAAGGAITDLDLTLAATITARALEAGATNEPLVSQATEIALDAMDIDAVRPFWKAVLGYVDDAPPGFTGQVVALKDPLRIGPSLWFQQMDVERSGRNRFHIDVTVPDDSAEARISAAIAAGGTLVTDEFAQSWWVLADAEGNEACICTWQDRD